MPAAPQSTVSRAMLRYLLATHSLAPGSRVAVCGGDAVAMTAALEELGLEVDTPTDTSPAEPQPLDAIVWIETARDGAADDSGAICERLLARLREGGSVVSVVDRDAAEPAVTAGAPARTVPAKLGLGPWFGRDGRYVVRTLRPTTTAAFEDEADVIPFDRPTRTKIPARRAA